MNWNLVNLADVVPSAWHNGAGSTRELLAWPVAGNWVWRLSVAEITHNAAFSHYPGIDRWISVLGGDRATAGVRLKLSEHGQAAAHELTPASEPFAFDGAQQVDCELLDGHTQDFNLMVRRGRASGQLHKLEGLKIVELNTTKTVAVYSYSKLTTAEINGHKIVLAPHSLAWCQLHAGTHLQLHSQAALWMEMTDNGS